MNISEYLKEYIKKEGRTALWVSQNIDMNYKTFVGKLNRNSLSADELFKISSLLDMDLEKMKEELNYKSLFIKAHNFIYLPIRDYENETFNLDNEICVKKMELLDKKCNDKNVLISVLGQDGINNFSDINKYNDIKVYAFIESEKDTSKYVLKEVSIKYLKFVDEFEEGILFKNYMVKNDMNDNEFYLKVRRTPKPTSTSSSPVVDLRPKPNASSIPIDSQLVDFYISSKE